MNLVELQGIIVGIRKGTVTSVTLRVQSQSGENFPRVTFSLKSKREKANAFERGDAVRIMAKVRPGTARSGVDRSVTYYKQNLEGLSIEPLEVEKVDSEPSDDNGVQKLFSTNNRIYENKVLIAGEVIAIRERQNMISALICPEGEVNHIWVDCFAAGSKELAAKLVPDTQVLLLGEIQTKRREKTVDGPKDEPERTRTAIDREFENVIVKQMVKLGDETGLDLSVLTKEQMEDILS